MLDIEAVDLFDPRLVALLKVDLIDGLEGLDLRDHLVSVRIDLVDRFD